MENTSFDKQILKRARDLFFPIIADEVITGYNVYKNRPQHTSSFLINYLHSDLGTDETGQHPTHLDELSDRLSKFGPTKINEKISSSIVDRVAVYKVGDWEENPKGLTFYDAKGNELSPDDLKKYTGLVVVEGKQYDLGLELSERSDVDVVLDVLHRFVFRYKLDKKGNILLVDSQPEINKEAIMGSWDIPLITLSSRTECQRICYSPVQEITLTEKDHTIATLVDKKAAKLESALRNQQVAFGTNKKLANNAFIDLYLNPA